MMDNISEEGAYVFFSGDSTREKGLSQEEIIRYVVTNCPVSCTKDPEFNGLNFFFRVSLVVLSNSHTYWCGSQD